MKKWILVLLIFTLLLPSVSVIFSETVYAAEDEELSSTASTIKNSCTRVMGEDEVYEKIDDFVEYRASLVEKYTLDFLEMFWNFFGVNTLTQLVFGNPFCLWFDGEEPELAYGLFPQEIKTKVIDPIFTLFSSLYVVALALSILISGLKLGYSFVGFSRFNMGEEMYMYMITAFLLVCYWMGIDYLFMFNWSIVSSLSEFLASQGISVGNSILISTADKFYFSDIIMLFAEWLLMLFINLMYIYRLFVITVLMMVGGLVIIGLLFEKTRKYFKLWLVDFIGAIFMQSIHALYFTMVLLFISLDSSGFIFKFILLVLFLPISSMLLGMMGISSALIPQQAANSMVGGTATALRMGSLGINKLRGSKSLESVELGKSRIATLANGSNSKIWGATKTAASVAGAVTGATAGMVIGPGGSALGGMAGAKIGGLALQAPRNVAAGLKSLKDTVGNAKEKGFENIMGNLQDKRLFYGNVGESVGTMVGLGETGRKVGEGFSGVSRQRLLNSDEAGGLGGITMQDIASKYPDANIQFQQTNEGSGFYMERDGEMKLISPIGAADPSLHDGATRTMDYRVTDSLMKERNIDNQSGVTPSYLTRMNDATINDKAGNSFVDPNFRADLINPDSYYRSGMQGSQQQSLSDKLADYRANKAGDSNEPE